MIDKCQTDSFVLLFLINLNKHFKMKKTLLLLLFLPLAFFATSCDKDKESDSTTDVVDTEVKDIKFIDVTSYTEWTYFSFSEGKVVEVEDFANSLDWDIAFHRADVRTNGGASGKGKGEALDSGVTDWDKVTAIPTDGFVKDEVGPITIAFTGTGTEEDDQPFSPPVYTLSNSIYIVKSADGKVVKIHFYDNNNEKDKNGAVSFRYQYLN